MARITERKLHDLAAAADRLVASIDRMQATTSAMLDNPRAKYVQVCRLLRKASTDLSMARSGATQAAEHARAGAPRTTADAWDDVAEVRKWLEVAERNAREAADSLRAAAAIV